MGSPKTKTVGGGSSTKVADSWNQFLGQGLSSGSFGANSVPYNSTNGVGGNAGTGSAMGDLAAFTARMNPQPAGVNNSFGGAIDQLLRGSNHQGTSANGVPNFMGDMTQLGKVDMNDPAFAALSQKLNQDTLLGRANMRERFGGNALNSGASLAESQYNAQVNPANVLAMQQLQAQMRGLNLNDFMGQENAIQGRMGMSSQSQLGNRGIDSSEALGFAGQDLQAKMAMINQLFGAYGGAANKGIAQAQTVEVQNPWMQGLQALGGIAQGAAGIYGAYKGNGGFGNMGGNPNSGTPNWQVPSMPGSFGGSGGIPSQSMPGQWNMQAPMNNSASFNPQNQQSNVMSFLQQNPQALMQMMQMIGGR